MTKKKRWNKLPSIEKWFGEDRVEWEINNLLAILLGLIIGGSIKTAWYCWDAPQFIEICAT